MSGYLSNLASRTIEQRPSIRPRLASVFEPASGPRIRVVEPLEEERSRPARSVSRRYDDGARPTRLTEAHVKPSPIKQPPEPAAGPAQVSHLPEDHRPMPTLASDSLSERSTQAITPHATVVSNTKSTLESPVPASASTASESGNQPVQAASPERAYQPELGAAHSSEAALLERTLAIEPAVSAPAGRTPAEAVINKVEAHPGPAVIVRPNVSANYESQPPSIEMPSITREAPSAIHITIGRVEVRAIMPPPAQPVTTARETKRGASLSLEDYLKKRNGA